MTPRPPWPAERRKVERSDLRRWFKVPNPTIESNTSTWTADFDRSRGIDSTVLFTSWPQAPDDFGSQEMGALELGTTDRWHELWPALLAAAATIAGFVIGRAA